MGVIDTASVKRSGAGGFTNIGSFVSIEKLQEAYPVPANGLAALVGIGDGTTGNEKEYVSDGGLWQELAGGGAPGSVAAADVTVTPVGGIAATDAQAALAELDSEKLGTTGTSDTAPVGPSKYVLITVGGAEYRILAQKTTA